SMIQQYGASEDHRLVPAGPVQYQGFEIHSGYTGSDGTQRFRPVPQRRADGRRRAGGANWSLTRTNEANSAQTRRARPEIPRMGLARHWTRPHHVARTHAA